MEFLTSREITVMNRRLQETYGTSQLIRDSEALDYIVKSASQEVFGRRLYDSVEQLSAYYLIKITKKHIFNDANKRTAFLATNKFLKKNGFKFAVPKQYEIANLIIEVAKVNGEPDSLCNHVETILTESIFKKS